MRGATFSGLLMGVVGVLVWSGVQADPPLPSARLAKGQSTMYAITRMTENEKSCDEEGNSVLGTQDSTFFVLKNVGDDRWGHYVYAVSCKDHESCQKALTSNVGGDWILMFNQNPSTSQFTGEQVSTGVFSKDQCTDPKVVRLTLDFREENKVRITKKVVLGPPYTPVSVSLDQPPMCRTDTALEVLKDLPCGRFAVIEGEPASFVK